MPSFSGVKAGGGITRRQLRGLSASPEAPANAPIAGVRMSDPVSSQPVTLMDHNFSTMELKHLTGASLIQPRHAERRQEIYVKTRPFLSSDGMIVIERRSHRERRRRGKKGFDRWPEQCALLQRRAAESGSSGEGKRPSEQPWFGPSGHVRLRIGGLLDAARVWLDTVIPPKPKKERDKG